VAWLIAAASAGEFEPKAMAAAGMQATINDLTETRLALEVLWLDFILKSNADYLQRRTP
jgi:hypothetical protein